ncbi:MAG: hypothetical protein FWC86_03990 [Coriobacteriia bacterium]|nr:hypothetical protein [Coriobacteriia bacterium]
MTERQSFDYPDPQMGLVLQHFYEQHPEVVDRAGQEFFAYVQATQERIPKEKIEQLFNEWLVYDFRLKTGKTALETYIYRNPDELDEDKLKLMQQAGESSYVGHFWIKTVNAKTQTLVLEECGSDASFKVYDATASQSIQSNAGLVAARLIQLDGNWFFASDPVFFLPIPSSEDGERLPFIDLVKLHYGIWTPPSNSA